MKELEEMFNKIGESLYTWEFACQLMAFFNQYSYEIGEQAVLNEAFKTAISICSDKLDMRGGRTPTCKTLKNFDFYINEIKNNKNVIWVEKIIERYSLKINKK